MRVNKKTAERLNANVGKPAGYVVRVVTSERPRRRWYSIGNWHDGQWHQVSGFCDSVAVHEWLLAAANNLSRTT